MFSVTATELNYLVFSHLRESGFTHAAFALGNEAGISKIIIDGNVVPPGALVTIVQKGLKYLELEAKLNCGDVDMDEEDFSFLQLMNFITKDVHELQKMILDKKQGRKARDGENEKDKNETQQEHDQDQELEHDQDREQERASEMEVVITRRPEENGIVGGPEPMESEASSTSLPCQIPSSEVMVLEGHTSEVLVCAWSRAGSLLATGSGDSTARIWSIKERPCTSILENGLLDVTVLKHYKGRTNYMNKAVATLDWNGDGTLLATGSYDGKIRVWNTNGELNLTLSKHKGPVFCLKWNKKGDYLVSGGVDRTAIVWDMTTRDWKQQFEFHSGTIMDVDWRDNVSFATCSTDNMIYVRKVGENRPIKIFSGHKGEVNAIKWDATGSLLASCSDDSTAKIWSMKQDTCLYDFKEHSKEIYTIEWSPTGPGTNNPNQQSVLASASFDSTIKLWDVESGSLLHSLNGHREPVYAIAFSPDGEYLASGSLDKSLHIWSVKEAKIVKTYPGSAPIFSVCWKNESDKIAACFVNNLVWVLDFRK